MDMSDLQYSHYKSHAQNVYRIGMSHLILIFVHCITNTAQVSTPPTYWIVLRRNCPFGYYLM